MAAHIYESCALYIPKAPIATRPAGDRRFCNAPGFHKARNTGSRVDCSAAPRWYGLPGACSAPAPSRGRARLARLRTPAPRCGFIVWAGFLYSLVGGLLPSLHRNPHIWAVECLELIMEHNFAQSNSHHILWCTSTAQTEPSCPAAISMNGQGDRIWAQRSSSFFHCHTKFFTPAMAYTRAQFPTAIFFTFIWS